MKIYKKAIFLITGAIAVAAFGTFAYLETTAATNYAAEAPQGVQTVAQAAEKIYTYSGNISTKNQQNCISGMALNLKEINVKKGDYVKKGQLLYTLDDSDISAQLLQAQAGINLAQVNLDKAETAMSDTTFKVQSSLDAAELQLNDARTNLNRTTSLYEQEAVSQVQYDQAKTAFSAAETQYNQAKYAFDNASQTSEQNISAARAQLQQAKASYDVVKSNESKRLVTAEIDGVVADIWGRENNTLTVGEKIMDIVDYNSLILEVSVDQYEISKFEIGQKVPVYVSAIDLEVEGTVSEISDQAVVKGEVSSFVVTIDLEKNDNLKMGLSAEARTE